MRRLIFILLLLAAISSLVYWVNLRTKLAPFSAYAAHRDIAKGEVKCYSYGLSVLFNLSIEQLDSLRQKYGFVEANLGCMADEQIENEIVKYNAVVEEYLIKRNGRDWQQSCERDYLRMLDVKTIQP